jgi:hypothetical protein
MIDKVLAMLQGKQCNIRGEDGKIATGLLEKQDNWCIVGGYCFVTSKVAQILVIGDECYPKGPPLIDLWNDLEDYRVVS